jgi:hypothetical protein
MEFPQRRRLVEEVKRRRHDGVERAILKWQLLGWAAQPLHPVGSGASLAEHAVRHVYALDLLGVQFPARSDH